MGLTISFIMLFSLLLWLIIGLRGNWALKSAVILIALLFSVSTAFSIENFYGWATTQAMPREYRVYWALAEEPDISSGQSGSIYFWAEGLEGESWSESGLRPLTFQNSRMNGVRSYRLPYSLQSHELVVSIVGKIISGEVVIASSLERDIPGEFILSEESGPGGSDHSGVMLYALPPNGIIRKEN